MIMYNQLKQGNLLVFIHPTSITYAIPYVYDMMVDSPFLQQSLSSWNPLLTPLTVFTLLFIIGIVFIPTGSFLLSNANAVNTLHSISKLLLYLFMYIEL
jgi:hypothetical protein